MDSPGNEDESCTEDRLQRYFPADPHAASIGRAGSPLEVYAGVSRGLDDTEPVGHRVTSGAQKTLTPFSVLLQGPTWCTIEAPVPLFKTFAQP